MIETQKELKIPTEKDLRAIPQDETVKAIVIDIQPSTWEEITIDEEKKKKLKNPTGNVLRVKYEANGFIREDIFPYTENPTTTSKYGRYIEKYGDFALAQEVKVFFDEEGHSEIILASKKKKVK